MDGLTAVSVDFETSHLIFPRLIAIVLALLGLAILVQRRREIAAAGSHWRGILGQMDKPRFFGTVVLTVAYFSAMVPVGDLWPNTGYGFLFCSVPFVGLTGLLFMHDRSPRALVPVVVTAVAAPLLVWWLFTEIFFLTLP